MSKNNSFEQMMNMWNEGQTAFFKAQTDAMENFEKVMSDAKRETETADPYAAWHQFIQAWAPNWDVSAMTGDGANELFTSNRDAFLNMLDPTNWSPLAPEQLRKILEGIADGPQFADLATPQIDAAEAWRETLDYQQAMAKMAQVLQDTWSRTLKEYTEEYSVEELNSGDVQGALDAWLKIANAELLRTQCSSDYLSAQRDLLRASAEIKSRMKDIAEVWSESYQMPTRTEYDDLAKIVHELRREVRKLKREVTALKSK